MDRSSTLRKQLESIEAQLADVRSFRYYSFEYADHLEQIRGRILKEIQEAEMSEMNL